MFNPFRKSKKSDDKHKLNMFQRVAIKKAMNMNPKEREKVMAEALKPENKDKILKVMEMMKKTGQVTDEQIETAKKQLGI